MRTCIRLWKDNKIKIWSWIKLLKILNVWGVLMMTIFQHLNFSSLKRVTLILLKVSQKILCSHFRISLNQFWWMHLEERLNSSTWSAPKCSITWKYLWIALLISVLSLSPFGSVSEAPSMRMREYSIPDSENLWNFFMRKLKVELKKCQLWGIFWSWMSKTF